MKQQALFFKSIFLIILSLTCACQPAYAKKMYKWVDDEGKVYFSDKIPPTQKDFERKILDKNARVIEEVEKKKTKAQLAMAKRLRALRRQKEKLIEEQKRHEKVLRSTFRNIEDMKNSHNAKLQAFDTQKKDMEKKLKALEENLAKQKKKAAQAEINNQKISKELLADIEKSHKDIEQVKLDIKESIKNKKITEKKFVVDRTRYLALVRSDDSDSKKSKQSINEIEIAVNQLGLFSCENKGQCDKAWNVARQFVQMNSSTGITIDTDKLIMTKDPQSVTDLSLSVSKVILENKKIQIFLDIRCRDTMKGQEICRYTKAKTLRAEFSDFIKAALGLETDKQKQAEAAAEEATKVKANEEKTVKE